MSTSVASPVRVSYSRVRLRTHPAACPAAAGSAAPLTAARLVLSLPLPRRPRITSQCTTALRSGTFSCGAEGPRLTCLLGILRSPLLFCGPLGTPLCARRRRRGWLVTQYQQHWPLWTPAVGRSSCQARCQGRCCHTWATCSSSSLSSLLSLLSSSSSSSIQRRAVSAAVVWQHLTLSTGNCWQRC